MADIVIFDPLDPVVPRRVMSYLRSVNTPDYAGNPNVLINPDLSVVAGVPFVYWKESVGTVVAMTPQERVDLDNSLATSLNIDQRNQAKSTIDTSMPDGKVLRAFADIVKDEINILRQWLTDFQTAVAAANNLADLKTSVSALPSLPARDLSQLKTTIADRIDSGLVD